MEELNNRCWGITKSIYELWSCNGKSGNENEIKREYVPPHELRPKYRKPEEIHLQNYNATFLASMAGAEGITLDERAEEIVEALKEAA